MALDINGYSATFKAFTDFAAKNIEAGQNKAIARASADVQTGALAGRTVTASSTDSLRGIFKWFRAADDQKANDATRTIFKNAIIDMFGGESKIPDSVKAAMKLADYGQGKPLTARRILAVKAAIDQVAEQARQVTEKMNACIEAGKAKYADLNKKGDADGLIKTAFTACNGNVDAMDILSKPGLLNKYLTTGDGKLRSEADVQKKVATLVANLDELKALAKTNPRIADFGKTMLYDMGKTVPPGTFNKILQCVNDAKLAPFQKLSSSSSGMAIHNAAKQMANFVNMAMEFSGAEAKLEGAEEKYHMRAFIASALISRCSAGALDKMRGAMTSQNIAKLNEYYTTLGKGNYFDGEPEDIRRAASDAGSLCAFNLSALSDGISHNLAVTNPDKPLGPIPDCEEELDIDDIGGNALLEDTIAIGKEMLAKEAKNLVEATVVGSGKGADAMKKVIMNKVNGLHDPFVKLNRRLNANASAMMNWSFCAEMKKNGVGTQFEKDIDRGCNATLTDGKTTIKLTQHFETARNELAQFVTGDPKATYDTLKNDEDKAKVHMLMSLISQETEKAGEDGTKIALDKRESEDGFNFGGFSKQDVQSGKGARAERTYVIEKRADGGISLHYNMDKPLKDVDDGTTDGDGYPVGEGSKFTCKMDYILKGEEFNRLAKLDYSKFDDSEGYNIFNRKVEMPDGTRQFRENKLEKIVDSFAQDFKVNAACHMDFTLKLNPAEGE